MEFSRTDRKGTKLQGRKPLSWPFPDWWARQKAEPKKRTSFKTERTTKLNWTADEGTMDEGGRRRGGGKGRRRGGQKRGGGDGRKLVMMMMGEMEVMME